MNNSDKAETGVNLQILIHGELVLRGLRADDAEALFPIFNDEEVMQYWSSGPHQNIDETRDYVAENLSGSRWRTWVITMGDDIAIGWVVLVHDMPNVNSIGYILSRKYWGRGIVSRAVKMVIDHGFDKLNLRRIWADTDPDNAASNHLLSKLGFKKEGHLRAQWETHIGIRDSYIWGLIQEDR
ncbi:hypothetical protein LPB140_06855 [Sphingorhabdus lutea]|uniref:N-acetyltransferase domain-containing protein n=1 Tax=Sphingorhabdus lutea TaxID=1913578 RepID=A0A1L3JBP7_9SPHN|nr:GNAT family N-acetyltransferase [Sphingorhabdus lutea]APG62548.1 hypothetical protein LPB140_06855 [Sphingorhabdus lutea]